MRDVPFPARQEHARQVLASAFSQDYLTMVEYEQRVEQLEGAETYAAVEALVADLPAFLAPALQQRDHGSLAVLPQILEGGGQILRRRGHWLRSDRLEIVQRGSMIRLRFDDLSEMRKAELRIDLDIQSCTAQLRFPAGTRVHEEFENRGSVVTVARRLSRRESPDGPEVLITGRVYGSTFRVTLI